MSAIRPDLRKGWCPGALRPMMAKDGLLVRLRIACGIVPADTAWALADLADAHGNGLFDLSARANLQMRGVRETALPPLLDGLRELGLLDDDARGEAVRNIIASPLAGLGAEIDIRPLVASLGDDLAQDPALHALPGKFGYLIDDGGMPTLSDVAADVRFEWSAEHEAFAVGLGGTRDTAVFAGSCAVDALVSRAGAIARAVVALQTAGAPRRRMRQILRDIGPADSEHVFGTQPIWPTLSHLANDEIVGDLTFKGRAVLGLAAPFGRLDAAMLRAAATLADRGLGELRLTPWRTILLPEASIEAERFPSPLWGRVRGGGRRRASTEPEKTTSSGWKEPPSLTLPHKGEGGDAAWAQNQCFITDAADPRLRVAACTGRDGCERGTTATHADAEALADLVSTLGSDAIPVHVSGCEKGCAKPSRSAVTLVGRDGRYDLVRDGTAGDAPTLRGLDLTQVRTALSRTPVPA